MGEAGYASRKTGAHADTRQIREEFTDAQIQNAFDNVFAVLREADMGPADVVRLNIYLTDAGDVAIYRRIRDDRMEGRLTASTLLVISALVDPKMKVEIEAVAAQMASPGRAA